MTQKIYAFPNWNTNPYLNMLYLEARSRGWQVEGRTHYHELMADLPTLSAGDVLHVHWTSPFAEAVKSGTQLRARIDKFDAAMSAAITRGVRLYWTVHNTIAHETDFVAEEVLLAKRLAQRASRIIVLNSNTADVVAEHYALPSDKIVRLPHASYAGIYQAPPARSDARRELGIDLGAHVVGFVGAIRPYKGVGALLRAAEILGDRDPRIAVALAGNTSQWVMREVEAAMPRHVPVHRKHGLLTDSELVLWASACDVLAFPYSKILNSGSMMLAATLGIVCVLPAEPHLVAEYGDQQWIEFFDSDVEDRETSLAGAIERCFTLNRGVRRQAALDFADSYTPYDMAVEFAAAL